MHTYLIAAALGYLLGSIPFGYVLVLLFQKKDIRNSGSGNIGATNVLRSGSRKLGIATLLLDLLKGLTAVLLAGWIARRFSTGAPAAAVIVNAEAVAAIAAILGHVFPLWLRFKGGKGVATGLGVFLALAWPAALVALLVFLLVFRLSRFVSLASIMAAGAFPLAAVYLYHGAWTRPLLACILFVPATIIAKHHANVRRLLNGTEYRFGTGRGN